MEMRCNVEMRLDDLYKVLRTHRLMSRTRPVVRRLVDILQRGGGRLRRRMGTSAPRRRTLSAGNDRRDMAGMSRGGRGGRQRRGSMATILMVRLLARPLVITLGNEVDDALRAGMSMMAWTRPRQSRMRPVIRRRTGRRLGATSGVGRGRR